MRRFSAAWPTPVIAALGPGVQARHALDQELAGPGAARRARALRRPGARPAGRARARGRGRRVTQVDDPLEACRGADVLVVATPWPAYAAVDPSAIRAALRGRVVIDPFGALELGGTGLVHHRLGRPVFLEEASAVIHHQNEEAPAPRGASSSSASTGFVAADLLGHLGRRSGSRRSRSPAAQCDLREPAAVAALREA